MGARWALFGALMLALAAAAPGAEGHGGNVEVIVDAALYASGEINASLDVYLADVQSQGYQPILTTGPFSGPAALRSHLAARHGAEGLVGAVFVGDLPIALYERQPSPDSYERFACDLYYMDLDGLWSDENGNGTYDGHEGTVAPEIWLGRLTTSPLTTLHAGRTEASLLNDYFQKNHAYRQGQMALAPNGLAYVDDDWSTMAPGWAEALGLSVAGSVEIVRNRATTTASDYKDRIATNQYESVLVVVHSSARLHAFMTPDGGGGTVYSSELHGLDPPVLFYNLYACSNADYRSSGYMAGEYVFGTSHGLLAVGSTKTGSMLGSWDYYEPLGEAEVFGAAMKNWWMARADGGFSESEKFWHYGMTMVGDPLLMTQEYVTWLTDPLWATFAVKPGGRCDTINADSLGIVPIAILGSETCDVQAIDANSLELAGAKPEPDEQTGQVGLLTDVDGDSILDLLVVFRASELDLPTGEARALLTGLMDDGRPLLGRETVHVLAGAAHGDCNFDGIINVGDLGILGAYYKKGYYCTWTEGDFTGDGCVGIGDLAILGAFYGTGGGAAVPEPAAVGLVAIGATVLLRRRSRP